MMLVNGWMVLVSVSILKLLAHCNAMENNYTVNENRICM